MAGQVDGDDLVIDGEGADDARQLPVDFGTRMEAPDQHDWLTFADEQVVDLHAIRVEKPGCGVLGGQDSECGRVKAERSDQQPWDK
jgi:hypothetical protein